MNSCNECNEKQKRIEFLERKVKRLKANIPEVKDES